MNIALQILLGIVLSIPFLIGIVYFTAQYDRQLTFNKTGEIKAVEEGGHVVHIMMNVPGKTWDKNSDTIVDGIPEKGGLRYVSWRYPIHRISEWEFTWPKLEAKTHTEQGRDNVLDAYLVVQKTAKIRALRYEWPYPVYVREIELVGNATVNILVLVTLRIKRPRYLIAQLKGNYMSPAIEEMKGIIEMGVRDLTLDEFRKLDKEEAIDKTILKSGKPILNDSLEVLEASYVTFDYVGNTKEVMDAITAKEVAKRQGEAEAEKQRAFRLVELHKAKQEVTKARGQAMAKRIRADADAYALTNTLQEASKYRGGVDLMIAETQRDAVTEFDGETLVLGSAKPIIGVGPKRENRPDRPEDRQRQQRERRSE